MTLGTPADSATAHLGGAAPLVNWPDNLVRQIASGRWILFIGAGVSATAVNEDGASPPGWAALLEELADGITDAGQMAAAHELVAANDYLRAGEHIRWAYASAYRREDYLNTIRNTVVGPEHKPFEPSQCHNALLDLTPNIVVSTNYDGLFEIASENGYNNLPYRSPYVGTSVRRGAPLHLKLHGSVDELDDLVVTRSDYSKLRSIGSHALEVLKALFLTHTALFVGYSLSDPDVQMVLEGVGSGYINPESHYLLTRQPLQVYEVETFRDFYGVATLTYDAAANIADVLAELHVLVLEKQTATGITPSA